MFTPFCGGAIEVWHISKTTAGITISPWFNPRRSTPHGLRWRWLLGLKLSSLITNLMSFIFIRTLQLVLGVKEREGINLAANRSSEDCHPK